MRSVLLCIYVDMFDVGISLERYPLGDAAVLVEIIPWLRHIQHYQLQSTVGRVHHNTDSEYISWWQSTVYLHIFTIELLKLLHKYVDYCVCLYDYWYTYLHTYVCLCLYRTSSHIYLMDVTRCWCSLSSSSSSSTVWRCTSRCAAASSRAPPSPPSPTIIASWPRTAGTRH